MLLVIGAPLAIWWWFRRTRGTSTYRLRVTDKAALGRNTWIAVAEIDGQRFLLGAGEHGVGLLSELGPAPVVEQEAAQDVAAEPATDRIAVPRMGLIERLQQMTLRTSTRPPRSFDALRR
jgi:flagellar biogenesis protein FliO